MSYEHPSTAGETYPLTDRHPAEDSYVSDNHGNKQPYVHGRIVKFAELDLPASKKFGEERLKWVLGVETTCIKSTAGDVMIEAIKPISIAKFRARFPHLFAEFVKKFGAQHLPKPAFTAADGIHDSLIGDYVPQAPLTLSTAERKRHLRAELEALEAMGDDEAEGQGYDGPSVDGYYANGTPLEQLDGIPVRARHTLEAVGIVTIEGLANLSELVIPDLGAGKWAAYREKAQKHLEDAGAA